MMSHVHLTVKFLVTLTCYFYPLIGLKFVCVPYEFYHNFFKNGENRGCFLPVVVYWERGIFRKAVAQLVLWVFQVELWLLSPLMPPPRGMQARDTEALRSAVVESGKE